MTTKQLIHQLRLYIMWWQWILRGSFFYCGCLATFSVLGASLTKASFFLWSAVVCYGSAAVFAWLLSRAEPASKKALAALDELENTL